MRMSRPLRGGGGGGGGGGNNMGANSMILPTTNPISLNTPSPYLSNNRYGGGASFPPAAAVPLSGGNRGRVGSGSAAFPTSSSPMFSPSSELTTAELHFSFISKQNIFLVTEATVRDVFNQFGPVQDVSIKKSGIDQVIKNLLPSSLTRLSPLYFLPYPCFI